MDQGYVTLLLGHLLAEPDLLHMAARKLSFYNLIDPLKHRTPAFLWTVIKDCYEKSGEPPTYTFLQQEIMSRLQPTREQVLLVESLEMLGDMAHIPKADLTAAAGRVLLEAALSEAAKISFLEQMRRVNSVKDLQKIAQRISSDLGALGGKRSARMKPLFNLETLLQAKNRIGFGVRFWDDNGGKFAPGELHGLLGPTGGGKTVMAVSVACGQVRAGRHTMLCLYEQPAEGDIMERICTHMTEMPIDTFRDKSFSDLPESVQRKLAFAQETNGKYLTLLDMLQDGAGAGGVPEIIQHIETAIAEGERPDLVIVDWFGAMVDRNHQFRSDIPHDLRYRVLGTQFMDMFNMYAKKSGVSFLLLHQLSTEASSHSSGHRPKKTDALEMKTFSNKMDTCAALGVLDKRTHVCWFCPDKSRRSFAQDIKIRLQGELQRFVDVKDEYEVRNNVFVPTEVPDAEREAQREKEYDVEL
jgi:hypothetical protein